MTEPGSIESEHATLEVRTAPASLETVWTERRGQNRVRPLRRPSADSEPEGGLDDFTLAGHRNGSVITPNAVGIKPRRIGALL